MLREATPVDSGNLAPRRQGRPGGGRHDRRRTHAGGIAPARARSGPGDPRIVDAARLAGGAIWTASSSAAAQAATRACASASCRRKRWRMRAAARLWRSTPSTRFGCKGGRRACRIVDVIADAQQDKVYVQRFGDASGAVDDLAVAMWLESALAWHVAVTGPGLETYAARLPAAIDGLAARNLAAAAGELVAARPGAISQGGARSSVRRGAALPAGELGGGEMGEIASRSRCYACKRIVKTILRAAPQIFALWRSRSVAIIARVGETSAYRKRFIVAS